MIAGCGGTMVGGFSGVMEGKYTEKVGGGWGGAIIVMSFHCLIGKNFS